jgi:hypothetical protein
MADDEDEKDEYVVSRWTPAELDAASESIIEALRQHSPQSDDELTGNTRLDRGLLLLAGGRLELEGRLKIVAGPTARIYWLS